MNLNSNSGEKCGIPSAHGIEDEEETDAVLGVPFVGDLRIFICLGPLELLLPQEARRRKNAFHDRRTTDRHFAWRRAGVWDLHGVAFSSMAQRA